MQKAPSPRADSLEDLSALIENIFDAALDAERWPGVLRQCAGFVGAQGAGLLTKGRIDHTGSVHYQVGVEPRFIELYETEFWKYDPLGPLLLFGVGEVTCRGDYIDDGEFAEGRFHREWAAPQGWVDAANIVIEKSATMLSLLSFLRSEQAGRVDEAMRRRIRLIFPHVRRAVLIGDALKTSALKADQFAAALDRLAAGLFLLDRHGAVVHANAAGHEMAEGGVLTMQDGRLVAGTPGAGRAIADWLVAADVEGRDPYASIEIVARSGERYVAHVLPLTAGSRRPIGTSYGAVSALFVQPAAFPKPSMPELIGANFGLTPAELRVLLAMGDADGTRAIAARLGIGESTVNTHLARIFAKTGTRRQAEVVKLLAAYSDRLAVQ